MNCWCLVSRIIVLQCIETDLTLQSVLLVAPSPDPGLEPSNLEIAPFTLMRAIVCLKQNNEATNKAHNKATRVAKRTVRRVRIAAVRGTELRTRVLTLKPRR